MWHLLCARHNAKSFTLNPHKKFMSNTLIISTLQIFEAQRGLRTCSRSSGKWQSPELNLGNLAVEFMLFTSPLYYYCQEKICRMCRTDFFKL